MSWQKGIHILRPGDPFREWIVHLAGDNLRDPSCDAIVSLYPHASHTVCRYNFRGEPYALVAKFFAEPRGKERRYNAESAMENEYQILKRISRILPAAKPLGRRKDFHCALVTEFIPGRSLLSLIERHRSRSLHDALTGVAHVHHHLHAHCSDAYRKDREFAYFHRVLDALQLAYHQREEFNHLLGRWWKSSAMDLRHGHLIHGDATPGNYIMNGHGLFALDCEHVWENAHPVHDLGILCAEMRNHFALKHKNPWMAEPYIRHYLSTYSKDTKHFRHVTDLLPFFMALGYARIARLHRHSGHGDYLIEEALRCLRSKA